MPIRFRCQYCNQLMGIARRKAGTEVECPTCKGKVIVPQSSAEIEAPPGAARGGLLEDSDIHDVLHPTKLPNPTAAGAKPATAAANPFHFQGSYDVEPVPGAKAAPMDPPPVGAIVLSPTKATIIAVAVILGLAVAFCLGVFVGMSRP